MAKVLDIRLYPDPILRVACHEVQAFDSQLATLIDDMIETMYDAGGIGLAAPQVGLDQQITVIDVSAKGDQPQAFINPRITHAAGEVDSEEGCLSIPDYRETVKRSEEIVVEAFDQHGKPFTVEADDLLAICLQHEIDHLNGILFVDHLSRLKRELFKRKFKKRLRVENG